MPEIAEFTRVWAVIEPGLGCVFGVGLDRGQAITAAVAIWDALFGRAGAPAPAGRAYPLAGSREIRWRWLKRHYGLCAIEARLVLPCSAGEVLDRAGPIASTRK